jgi:hypothetical protein
MNETTGTTESSEEELAGRLDLQLEQLLELVFQLEEAASREDRLEAAIHYVPAQGRRQGR